MGKSRTHITQPFEIKIDISSFLDVIQAKLHEAIALSDKNISNVFLEDWELDGEYVEFKGSYRTGAETWYYRQTLEEPEDSGFEPDTSLSKRDIEMEFNDQISKFIDVETVNNTSFNIKNPMADLLKVAIVDDDFEPEFDSEEEFDDNDAYDRWRDAYYDRGE